MKEVMKLIQTIGNGYSSKTIESSFGKVGLDIPRDRKAQFEPKVVKKV